MIVIKTELIEKQNTFLLIVVTFALIWLMIVIKTEYQLSNMYGTTSKVIPWVI